VVITSTPRPKNSSAMSRVIPKPPAAFSPLTTTRSMSYSAARSSRAARSARRPSFATTSPANNISIAISVLGQYGRRGRRGPAPDRRLVGTVQIKTPPVYAVSARYLEPNGPSGGPKARIRLSVQDGRAQQHAYQGAPLRILGSKGFGP